MSPAVFLALSSSYARPSKESGLGVRFINSSLINIGSSGLLLNYRRAPSFLLLISNPILLSFKSRTSTSSYKGIYKSETLICFCF